MFAALLNTCEFMVAVLLNTFEFVALFNVFESMVSVLFNMFEFMEVTLFFLLSYCLQFCSIILS